MPCVGHPWRKNFCDAWFIVMEVDTSVMIILVMSWNTSTTTHVWLSWFCHKIVMDVHAWQKTWPTVTNTYHHGSVFFCSVLCSLLQRTVHDHSTSVDAHGAGASTVPCNSLAVVNLRPCLVKNSLVPTCLVPGTKHGLEVIKWHAKRPCYP